MTTEHPEEDPSTLPITDETAESPAPAETDQPVPDQPDADQPDAQPAEPEQPVDLISSDVAPKLVLEDVEPEAPPAPDLAAVEPEAPAQPTGAPSLDLPSLELPNPAPPIVPPSQPVVPPAPPIPPNPNLAGGDYAENSARAAYGQPTPQPAPQPSYTQPPYAESPYGQQQYGQQQYGQQQYGQQYPPAPPGYALVPTQQFGATDENTWSTAAHWSAILASVIGLGFLGPLLVMLVQGPKSARVRANAVESLNFEITFIIAMIASVILTFVVVGVIGLIAFPIAWLILRIVASVQTSSGRDYRYPVNIRLVK